ncbi:MAG: DUF1768 domain-containing protein, partial [Clostridia bacterium]|nr:DUF1768 domain-containing protein [Clostridia bacterium]
SMRGVSGLPRAYVHEAVSDWKKTQASTVQEVNRHKRYSAAGGSSWLLDVPELYARRLPAADPGELPGVSWILPLALRLEPADLQALDQEGASLAELLLDHDLAPMTAAVLTHIISRIIYPPEGRSMHFRDIVLEARDTVAELYAEESETQRLVDTIDRALQLSEPADGSIEENARPFGEGRSPDEILGISLYCALRHPDHFSDGVLAAVRYGGDRAAAGALTGSLLGALLGYRAIPDAWKQDLELDDVILETADDLCHGCQMSEYSHYEDPDWEEKYMHMRRPMRKLPMVFFWKENQENGWFSNWFRKPFAVDGVTYSFVEKYMMAEKARLFHDTERYDAILQAEYPWECKELGRQVTPFDSAAWNAVKYDVVKTASRAKYEQNPELMARLLQTGDALLAEASPTDRVWGIGLDASDAAKNDPRDWPGENLLGRILMELRAEFTDKVTQVSGTILRAVTGEQAGTSAAEAVIRTDRGVPGVKITTPHNVRPEAGGSSYRYVIHTSSLFR